MKPKHLSTPPWRLSGALDGLRAAAAAVGRALGPREPAHLAEGLRERSAQLLLASSVPALLLPRPEAPVALAALDLMEAGAQPHVLTVPLPPGLGAASFRYVPEAPTCAPAPVEPPNAAEPAPPAADDVFLTSVADDPTVAPLELARLPRAAFELAADGRPAGLVGPRVELVEGVDVYSPSLLPILPGPPRANNPFSPALPDADGNFSLEGAAARFGQVVASDRESFEFLFVKYVHETWQPIESHLGQTIAFESLNELAAQADAWAGRPVAWGEDGKLKVFVHHTEWVNAAYDLQSRVLSFGVVVVPDAADDPSTLVEVAASAYTVKHEGAHALHAALKPDLAWADDAAAWGESLADQLALWSELKDPSRVEALLLETGGDFSLSSSHSRGAELLASSRAATDPLWEGPKEFVRDAVNALTLETAGAEPHDQSRVLTGAVYQLFLRVFADQRGECASDAEALQRAADVMGWMTLRAVDHTPEVDVSHADVARAYLKVDREYFGGRYGPALAAELLSRGLLSAEDLAAFEAHEEGLPEVTFAPELSPDALGSAVAEALFPGREASVVELTTDVLGQRVVRLALAESEGQPPGHARVVLRADGSVMDVQADASRTP